MSLVNVPSKRMLESEEEICRGRIYRLVKRYSEYVTPQGSGVKELEMAERSPGVRAIIVRDGKILMIRELRTEHDAWDYRLPGGKVYDLLQDYLSSKKAEIIEGDAKAAVARELQEEVGIEIRNARLLHKSVAGATIVWDLYYYEVDEFDISPTGSNPEDDELIQPEWRTLEQVKELCLSGAVMEDRSAAVLLRYVFGRPGFFGS